MGKEKEKETEMVGSSSSSLSKLVQFEEGDPLVDSALGILGLSTPSLYDPLNTFLLQNLSTLLLSTISSGPGKQCLCFSSVDPLDTTFISLQLPQLQCKCKFSHGQSQCGDKTLLVGSSSSETDLMKVVTFCIDYLKGNSANGPLVMELLEILIRVVSLKCPYKVTASGRFTLFEREEKTRKAKKSSTELSAMDSLLTLISERRESLYNKFKPSTRMLIWWVQPEMLKEDLSLLLQKAVERPLLSFQYELQHHPNLVVALALHSSPFSQARTLLIEWLLSTGAVRIWEARVLLAYAVREVLESPSVWGLPLEAAPDLPTAKELYNNDLWPLLKILVHPPTLEGLHHILNTLQRGISSKANLESAVASSLKDIEESVDPICHFLGDSVWSLLTEFTAWIQFASLSLFQKPEGSHDMEDNNTNDRREIAASYISWLISPHKMNHRRNISKMLMHISDMWLCIYNRLQYEEGSGKKRRRLSLEIFDNSLQTSGPNSLTLSKKWLCEFSLFRIQLDTGPYMNKPETIPECSIPLEASTSYSQGYFRSGIFSFLDSLPLAALATCSKSLNYDISALIFDFVFLKREYIAKDSTLTNLTQNASREGDSVDPNHDPIEEEFRDDCESNPVGWLRGAAQIFTFLETLELQEEFKSIEFGLSSLKEVIGVNLLRHVEGWLKDMHPQHLIPLTDLHHRLSLWVSRHLYPCNTTIYKQVLTKLDLLISSLLALS